MLTCYFCGSRKIRIQKVGISLSVGGDDYSFCEDCLRNMSADEFWESFFISLDYAYPPKLMKWAQDAVDNGINIEDARWPENTKNIICGSNRNGKKEKERSKINNSLRYDIMRRDNFHCQICGATGKDDVLVVDHVHPIAKGGKSKKENLRTLCQKCNSGKRDKVE